MNSTVEKYRFPVTTRAKHQCEYCHYPQRASNTFLEIEHIVPRSKQGETVLENLALACRRCNSHKSNKTDGIDPVRKAHQRRSVLWLPVNVCVFSIRVWMIGMSIFFSIFGMFQIFSKISRQSDE